VLLARDVLDVDDVHELQELVRDLLDHGLVAGRDERETRYRGVVGRGDAQGLDVVAARRKEPGHPGERPDLVLQRDGNDVAPASHDDPAGGTGPPLPLKWLKLIEFPATTAGLAPGEA
jgi:hypothetical protein